MRFIVCGTCRRCYQVGGDPKEIDRLLGDRESFPCITPLCGGRLRTCDGAHGYLVEEIPLRSFYRGIHGFGASKGAPASLSRLRELLLNQRVADINAEDVGRPARVIVRQLILEDGTRLHFDVSSKGACLYYIEEAGPSCVEVFDADDVVSPVGNGDSCREEVGRAVKAHGDISEGGDRAASGSAATTEQPDTGGMSPVSETDCVLSGDGA